MLCCSVKDHAYFCRNPVFFDRRKVRQESLFFNFRFGRLANVVLLLVILKDLVVGFDNLCTFSLEGLLLALESHESNFIVCQLWFNFFPGDSYPVPSFPYLQCLRHSCNCYSLFCCHSLVWFVHNPQGFKLPKCMQNAIRWRWLVDLTTVICACEVGMRVALKILHQCGIKAHPAQIRQMHNRVIWLVTTSSP